MVPLLEKLKECFRPEVLKVLVGMQSVVYRGEVHWSLMQVH